MRIQSLRGNLGGVKDGVVSARMSEYAVAQSGTHGMDAGRDGVVPQTLHPLCRSEPDDGPWRRFSWRLGKGAYRADRVALAVV